MKLAHFLGLALAVAPLAAIAQTSLPTPQFHGQTTVTEIGSNGQTTTFTVVLPPSPCPVAFQARHLADFGMVETGASHAQGPGQRLHLMLTSPDARTLARATVNVRGWTAHGHMENTGAASQAPAVRTVQVSLAAGNGPNAWANLWAPGLTAVDSVELLSVSFADGSTWAPAAGKRCRITPDPLMLVSR